MSVILVFIVVVASFCAWWLSQQRLMAKPWLEAGNYRVDANFSSARLPVEKLGLAVLLAVLGALFALFASAYVMRMEVSDWRPTPMPRVLWVSTSALVVSSLSLHLAVVAARTSDVNWVRAGMAVGIASALAFLVFQWSAWRELTASGFAVASGPASSFFYLLTGLHALHVGGGIVALGLTSAGAFTGALSHRLRTRVEMCAMYWHFLLFVWIGLFALMSGWAGEIVDICRRALAT